MPPAAVLPPPPLTTPQQPAAAVATTAAATAVAKLPKSSTLTDPPTQPTVSELPRAADHQPPSDPAVEPTMGAAPTPSAVSSATTKAAAPLAGVPANVAAVSAPTKRVRLAEPSVATKCPSPSPTSTSHPTALSKPPPPSRPVSKPSPTGTPAKQPTHQPPSTKVVASNAPPPTSSPPKATPSRIEAEVARLLNGAMTSAETPSGEVTRERPARADLERLAAPKPSAPPELAEYWYDFMEAQEEEETEKETEGAKKADPLPWDAYVTSQSVIDALIHLAVDRVQPGFGCRVTARLRLMSKEEQLGILCDEEHQLRRICAQVVDETLTHSTCCAVCVKSVSALFTKRSEEENEEDEDGVKYCTLDSSRDEMCTCVDMKPKVGSSSTSKQESCGCELMGDVVGAFLQPQLEARFATRHPWMAADLASAIVQEASCEAEIVCLLEDPVALFRRMVGEVEDALFSLTQRARRKVLREDMRQIVQKIHSEKFHKVLAIIMREKDDIALIRLLQHPDQLAQRVTEANAEVAENEEKAREKRALKRQALNDANRAKTASQPSPPYNPSPPETAAVTAQRALLQSQRARTQRTGTMHLYRTAGVPPTSTTASASVAVTKPVAQPSIRAIPLVRELETPAQRPTVRAGPALPAIKRRKIDSSSVNVTASTKPSSTPSTASVPTTAANVNRSLPVTATTVARSKFNGNANRLQPVTAPAAIAAARLKAPKPAVRNLVRPTATAVANGVTNVHTVAARIRPPAQPKMPAPQLTAKRPAPTTAAVPVKRHATAKVVTASSARPVTAASRPVVTAANVAAVTASRTQPVVSRVALTAAATGNGTAGTKHGVTTNGVNGVGVKKTTVVARPANGVSPNTKVLHPAAAQVRRPNAK